MCFIPQDARDISELDETERNKLFEGGALGDTFGQVTACVHLPYEINRDLSPECFPKGCYCVNFILKPNCKSLYFNSENICIGYTAESVVTDKAAYRRILNESLFGFLKDSGDCFK